MLSPKYLNGETVWLNTTLTVKDRGYPNALSSHLKLSIRVNDINDNIPIFVKDIYDVSTI